MKHVYNRAGSLFVFALEGATLAACSSTADTRLGELEGDPRSGAVAQLDETAQSAPPLPPPGYTMKRSTCTHFVESSAKLPNNSRIVNVADDGSVPLQRVEPLGDPDTDLRRMTSE